METIVKAVEAGDGPALLHYITTHDHLDHIIPDNGNDSVRRRLLRVLVDAPLRVSGIGSVSEWHKMLISRFANYDTRVQVLKMVTRETAYEYIASIDGVEDVVGMAWVCANEPRLLLAIVNRMAIFDEHTINDVLKDINVNHEQAVNLIEHGVHLKPATVLAVMHADSLVPWCTSFWTNMADTDPQRQSYNAIIMMAVMGCSPGVHVVGTSINLMLFDGIQARLDRSGVTHHVAKLVGELVLRTEDGPLRFKCDWREPLAKALSDAHTLGRRLYDRWCIDGGHPTVLYTNDLPSVSVGRVESTTVCQSDEAMAKNDKSRVRWYLSDCLQALNQHDNQERKREAITVLCRLLPQMDDCELLDHQHALIDKLLSNLPTISRQLVLTVRVMAMARMPVAMTTSIVRCIFTPANIGLTEKVDLMTSVVRCSQHAIGRVPLGGGGDDGDLLDHVKGMARCKPELICVPFLEGCLDYIPRRRKLLQHQSGWFAERLLMAMATMVGGVPECRAVPLFTRLADTVVGLCGVHGKVVRRAGCVLLLAVVEHLKQQQHMYCGVAEWSRFIANCGTVIDDCLTRHNNDDGDERGREVGLVLAGSLRETFTVERVLEELCEGVDIGIDGLCI